MSLDSAAGAIQRFQFSSQDEAETEEFIRQMYVGNRYWFHGAADQARFTVAGAETDQLATDDIRSTADYTAQCEPFGYYVFHAVYHGRMRTRFGHGECSVEAGDASFYPVDLDIEVVALDLGTRIVRLPKARLAAMAEEAVGISPAELRFDPHTPVSPELARRWAALAELTGVLLDDGAAPVSPLLAEELARTAATTALHTFPNSTMAASYQAGPGWMAPSAVRRATAYMQAHADEPITLGQVAAAAGVSARALQYAFRREYDVTPTGFLRHIRLDRARTELRAGDPARHPTVATVARRWGWVSPSQFAAAYRDRFGELPSDTLRQG